MPVDVSVWEAVFEMVPVAVPVAVFVADSVADRDKIVKVTDPDTVADAVAERVRVAVIDLEEVLDLVSDSECVISEEFVALIVSVPDPDPEIVSGILSVMK